MVCGINLVFITTGNNLLFWVNYRLAVQKKEGERQAWNFKHNLDSEEVGQ